jgi:hypothetical protein
MIKHLALAALLACVAGALGAAPCDACGYNCDDNCNCGRCNTKRGCDTQSLCLGPCDFGGNAKWCGGSGPAPPTPTPPSPSPPSPHPLPMIKWTTSANQLLRNGSAVVLHGFGTTCTEYLTRGIGQKCWATYNWNNASALLSVDETQVAPLLAALMPAASATVQPAVRIPLTASSWLGVVTKASKANFDKYPHLDVQYQDFISALVDRYTQAGAVAILDLHWTDDDNEETPTMAGAIAPAFWDAVAARFGSNPRVFYEIYNEPHVAPSGVQDWVNNTLGMLAAIRAHTTNPVLIGGATDYAYDADSLVALNAALVVSGNGTAYLVWNFHPYMGPAQAGDNKKCPAGFEALLSSVLNQTAQPAIITEFGQGCQPTHAASESCPASSHGYCEDVFAY